MYTVEMDMDETLVTILDETGNREDVSFFLYDDMMYVQQWNPKKESYDIIIMSIDMWAEFTAAMNSPEGAYVTR